MTDNRLAIHHRLGPYEIVALLGHGGMGEVYRARDTRLGRDVALKILAGGVGDHEARLRFEREARLVSKLSHPHIGSLFDVGREGEVEYLVMELLQGETLSARLARGPLAMDQVLRWGAEIASALAAAHAIGIVHRDLKPANVMITSTGTKLLDFGIARATDRDLALTTAVDIPDVTGPNVRLGTLPYMAPEQIEGGPLDARTDLFAFGAMLFEMATGRRAFAGEGAAATARAVLTHDPPPISSLRPESPPVLDAVVRRCLAKDPAERWNSAADLSHRLLETSTGHAAAPAKGAARRPWRTWATAAGILAALAVLVLLLRRPAAPAPLVRFELSAIPDTRMGYWPRVSPDGRSVAMVVADSLGNLRAYVRHLEQIVATPIPGTEGVRHLSWSPDGREIMFAANDNVCRLPVAGGSAKVVGTVKGARDLSWGERGQVLIAAGRTDSLQVLPAKGGEPRPATVIDRSSGEIGSGWPFFLPDGEHFLFIGFVRDAPYFDHIRLGRLGSLESTQIGITAAHVEWSRGYVLYEERGSLLARRLDLQAGRLVGDPVQLVDEVKNGPREGFYSVSRSGVLAIARNHTERLVYRSDRGGRIVGKPLTAGRNIHGPVLSADGRRLLYDRRKDGSRTDETDLYMVDLERGTETRLTTNDFATSSAAWSPDGRRFAYVNNLSGKGSRIQVEAIDGVSAPHDLAIRRAGNYLLTQWLESGNRIVFYDRTSGLPFIMAVDDSDHSAAALADSGRPLMQPQISPDGHWIAGISSSNEGPQVYVEDLVGHAGRWRINTQPGYFPKWTRNGKELVFEGIDGWLMAADVDGGAILHAGLPHALFRLPFASVSDASPSWTCDPAGDRFFLVAPASPQWLTVEVITDFQALLKGK